MRRMYRAKWPNLMNIEGFLGRAVVCLCPNVSEFARMYPNVSECLDRPTALGHGHARKDAGREHGRQLCEIAHENHTYPTTPIPIA